MLVAALVVLPGCWDQRLLKDVKLVQGAGVDIAAEGKYELTVALQKNDDFPLGALAIDQDGDYCLLYSASIAGMSLADFDLLVRVLARTADKLETSYSGTDEH